MEFEVILICVKMSKHEHVGVNIPIRIGRTKNRFATEAKCNSEMSYFLQPMRVWFCASHCEFQNREWHEVSMG